MVVLAIVCVAPAHPAATMQWARLWAHVGAHNEFFPKGCQNSTSWEASAHHEAPAPKAHTNPIAALSLSHMGEQHSRKQL